MLLNKLFGLHACVCMLICCHYCFHRSHGSATLANPLVIVPTDNIEEHPELMAALDLTSNSQVRFTRVIIT
jgi:hypothetical protein